MVAYGEIKMKVESGHMEYSELVNIWEDYIEHLDRMYDSPEKYDCELELKDIEDWMLELFTSEDWNY